MWTQIDPEILHFPENPKQNMAEPDLYGILGVTKNASSGEIKKVLNFL